MPEQVAAVVSASVDAIIVAWKSAEPTELGLGTTRFADEVPVAWTSEPCHGTAFFQGTSVDGSETPAVLIGTVSALANSVKALRLSPLMRMSKDAKYYRRLYAAQGNKPILLEAGRKQILGRPMGGVTFCRVSLIS